MKAVVCTRYGPPQVLRVEELATPVPRKNEVRIRILATAVTSSDCYVRGLNLSPAYRVMARLALGWNGPRQPVLGMVLSGVADAVGPDVRSLGVGERVFGFNRHRFGAYAQYVCWPEDGLLATRPANLTDVEAAAIPYGGLLALHFLRKAGVRAGQQPATHSLIRVVLPKPAGAETRVSLVPAARPSFSRSTSVGRRTTLRREGGM